MAAAELDHQASGMQSYACTVHGPITFPGSQGAEGYTLGLNEFLKKLIDTAPLQRLRSIKQNGLCHLVFNTMEHSRFAHSLGVAFIARRMVDRITLNSDLDRDAIWPIKYQTIAAALLHDIGHGPFSHLIEEILRDVHRGSPEKSFCHEEMTKRIIEDPSTDVYRVLSECNASLPSTVADFFDKNPSASKKWFHRIVSSQLDADRLDYILRDSQMAGMKGCGYDLDRILQHLFIDASKGPENAENFILDAKAIEALESALLVNDQLYRAVYYHRKARIASAMLKALLLRVATLVNEGSSHQDSLFGDDSHPLLLLLREGGRISVASYLRITDYTVWNLIDKWANSHDCDTIITDYSEKILNRHLHTAKPCHDSAEANTILEPEIVHFRENNDLGITDDQTIRKYYVFTDTSRRKSYKAGESIYIGKMKDPTALAEKLEETEKSRIVKILADPHVIEYVVFPAIPNS
jgi:HD superfamily phosphohydrolase